MEPLMGDAFDQLDTQTPTTPAQNPTGDAFDQLDQQQPAQTENDPQKTGEITNDVGNKVIVPKDGESFDETMKRAVQHYQSLSPEQRQAAIDKEVKTMPGKAATTLAAAPVIGAAGAAGLAVPGELVNAVGQIPAAAERVLQMSEQALEHLAENYPQLTKLAAKLGYGAGAAGAYKLLNKLGIH
jgi:hypothetical protein